MKVIQYTELDDVICDPNTTFQVVFVVGELELANVAKEAMDPLHETSWRVGWVCLNYC